MPKLFEIWIVIFFSADVKGTRANVLLIYFLLWMGAKYIDTAALMSLFERSASIYGDDWRLLKLRCSEIRYR